MKVTMHRPLILNIGTRIGATREHLTITQIVQAIERADLGLQSLAVHASVDGTERTIVAVLETHPDPLGPVLHSLAAGLAQDCVAAYLPTVQAGRLVGPAADAWGPFDSRYFLLPDGSRLSDSQPVVLVA